MPTPGTGLILGRDAERELVSLRLFRPEPTRVTLIGGAWACQIIMLRALALGARMAILTTTPEWWDGFGEWATGNRERVAVLPVEHPVDAPVSSQEPLLLLYDAGLLGPSVQPTLGPWQTQVTVLRQLTGYGLSCLQESNLVLTQRMSPAEVELLTPALRLGEQAQRSLAGLDDDMFALLGGGGERYVRVAQTRVESQQLGPARR
jgi:hypothetical protein